MQISNAEIYSGIEFYKLLESGEINGMSSNDLAHDTAFLSEEFQPYGSTYSGGVQVTSGYILSRPDAPNGQAIQTSNANITTLATGDFSHHSGDDHEHHGSDDHEHHSGDDHANHGSESGGTIEKIQVWTFLGGGHGHHSSHSGSDHDSEPGPELRLDKAFTPTSDVVSISGTFSDIPDGQRGEPMLFAQTASGDYELIYLTREEGDLRTFAVANSPEPTLIVGTPGNDRAIANDPNSNVQINGIRNTIFTGAGNDEIDLVPGVVNALSSNDNRVNAGSGNDILYVNKGDRVFGGAGNDTFDATDGNGGNRMSGGDGDDTFFLGAGDRLLGGNGNDQFYVQIGGGNLLSGGAGADQFWMLTDAIPSVANTIADFVSGVDVIGIANQGAGVDFNDLSLVGNTIAFKGQENQPFATLTGIQTNTLTAANFVFA